MAMNTTYLSMNTSAQSCINSPYITSGVVNFSNTSSAGTMWVQDFVVRGSYTTSGAVVFGSTMSVTGTSSLGVIASASAASFGAITGTTVTGTAETLTSTLTVGGKLTATSIISAMAGIDASAGTQSKIFSYQTTASATSLNLPDGCFGVYFESVTSARLCFRSGATTYTWIATTGAIL